MIRVIKNIFKKILYQFFSQNYQGLTKIIDNYDYISFDIFDTLIKRNVENAIDIFTIIEEKYNIPNFKKIRMETEESTRENSKYEDITLDDIYQNINIPNKDEVKNLEIVLEKDFCTLNKPMMEIYKYSLSKNKKIFLTSDMYLDIKTIEDILNNLGIKNYNKIYLSSKEHLRKATGNLFKKILKDNNIPKDKLLHLGDSILGDFLIPKKLGIKSILLKRKINNSEFNSKNNSLDYNILSSFINNNIDINAGSFAKFGYEVLGPILYDFTSWIHEEIKKDKIDKIYFLARDAKIIMDVYQKRFKDDIPTYYLKISRKAVVKASLDNLKNWDDLIYRTKTLIFTDVSSVQDLLDSLQLSKDISFKNKLIKELTINEKEEIFNLIKEDIETNSKIQNDYLKQYLKQNDFTGNIAIIDIGWNGTIQYHLEKYTDKNTKLFGYYYGINAQKFSEYSNITRKGYLFNSNELSEFQSIIRLSVGIFEIMFLTSTPSTIGYKKVGKNIKPIYGINENNEVDSIKIMQKYAQIFINDVMNNNIEKYMYLFSKECFFENYRNFAVNPSFKYINMFKDLDYSNVNNSKLIQHKSLIFYIFHPKKFYIDLKSSNCHIMFMKSVFKIPLPYYKILCKLYIKRTGR